MSVGFRLKKGQLWYLTGWKSAVETIWMILLLTQYLSVNMPVDTNTQSFGFIPKTKQWLWIAWWSISQARRAPFEWERNGHHNKGTLASSKWGRQTANYSSFITALQSVCGSIFTVMSSCREGGEQRGGENNGPLLQSSVSGVSDPWAYSQITNKVNEMLSQVTEQRGNSANNYLWYTLKIQLIWPVDPCCCDLLDIISVKQWGLLCITVWEQLFVLSII